MAGKEDLVGLHVADVDVGKGYVEFFKGGVGVDIGTVVLDAGVYEEDVAFFDGNPFSVQHKMTLTGQDQGDFYEVVAVGAFGFLSGQLAGEEERWIQVVVGDVVLYLAHGGESAPCVRGGGGRDVGGRVQRWRKLGGP